MNIWQIDAKMAEIIALAEDEELVDLETGEVVTVGQALERLEMAREEKIENAALAVKNLTAQAAAIKAEEDSLSKRRKALESKAEDFKRYLIAALTREDGTSDKVTTPRAAVSVRLNPAKVVISNEAQLPKEFFRETVTVSLDKAQLKEVLSRGIAVPGATLERGRSVVIK